MGSIKQNRRSKSHTGLTLVHQKQRLFILFLIAEYCEIPGKYKTPAEPAFTPALYSI